MAKFNWRKDPDQQPLIPDSQRMTWTRPVPAPQPVQKVGPVAPPMRPRAVAKPGMRVDRTFDQQQWDRMWELRRRVEAGEPLEQVKRELWPDQYKGEA